MASDSSFMYYECCNVHSMILIVMCTYHTGDNHSGPLCLGAGGIVRNLAISVLVVCT